MALPYPNPDPVTDQWEAFAMKRNLEYLDDKSGSAVINPSLSTVLFRETGNPIGALASSAAQTTIFSVPINSDVLGGERMRTLEVKAQGIFYNESGNARSLIIRVKLGGTTFATFDFATVASSATPHGWSIETSITSTGTNTQFSWGEGRMAAVGIGGESVALSSDRYSTFADEDATEASESNSTLLITAQNSFSSNVVVTTLYRVLGTVV